MKIKIVRWRLFPLLSAGLTSLAFVNTQFAVLVFIGLVPFIIYTQKAGALTRRQIIVDCIVAFAVFSAVFLFFMLQTDPSNWVNLNSTMSIVMKIFVWLISSLMDGLVVGLLMALTINQWKRTPLKLLTILPFTWIIGELLRSYAGAIFTLGPGSSLSPNWNFGALGLPAADTPLGFISRFIGLFGLSLVVILINISIYLAIKKRFRLSSAIFITIVTLNIIAWKIYVPTNQSVDVAAIYLSGDGDSLKTWGNVPLPSRTARLIALPEHSDFFANKQYYPNFAKTNFNKNAVFVSSQAGPTTPPTNDVVYYSNQAGVVSRQPKTFLAPFGEYMPYATTQLLQLFGQQSVLNDFKRNSEIKPGLVPEHAVLVHGLSIGGLACSGVLNLNQYSRMAKEGANILTNSASLSLLKTASLYQVAEIYENHFHAIANAKPFVQASRSGDAYILSSDGKVLAHTGNVTTVLEKQVQLQPKRTLYTLL